MNLETLMPDYNHSILNLINSILKKYNVQSKYRGLSKLDNILEKEYKNVVLVVLDGMGESILNNFSKNGLFKNNEIDTITSVYPSTTTAAMTTYYSGKPPIETGWIAWSQYFKEYGKSLDLFPEKDSYTGDKLKISRLQINDIMGYKTVYELIRENNNDVKSYEIQPIHCAKKAKITMTANNIEEMCECIETLCTSNENKFIMAYNDNPDGLLHKFGCKSEEVKEFIENTEKEFEKLVDKLKETDTLIIISADHGHNDIEETIDVVEEEELQECLLMPPSLESRATSFLVKEDMKKEFEDRFNKKYGDRFKLYTKEEFLEKGFLGFGEKHNKIDDFLGNYIAISIASSRFLLGTDLSRELKKPDEKKSTHCGLTRNEMEVPLIVFDLK